jgi:hypothetical protein
MDAANRLVVVIYLEHDHCAAVDDVIKSPRKT